MEQDTGLSCSVIGKNLYQAKFGSLELRTTATKLTMYTGEPVSVQITVTVETNGQKKELYHWSFVGNGSTVAGSWLVEPWHQLKKASTPSDLGRELPSKYADLFDGALGKLQGISARLNVKKGAQPVFYKPHPELYAQKEKIAVELDRLESIAVIEKVEHSDWAAPIVPVLRPDNSVRICGDYKVAINPAWDVQQYPLPMVEDLFTKLNGRQPFSKLDLSSAYQQVELEESSRNYVCINSHKALYRYTRLWYGVTAVPAIF